jgi:tetraacyldisaccharide 4'-kinase
LSEIYGSVVERRFRAATPARGTVPVICVGNFTAGGTGKTPLTRFLIAEAAARGLNAVCLTRGYGGALAGPVWVDPVRLTAREVGDEPLLIARDGRVMVARDRAAGLAAIEAQGGTDCVVMDDGLQNASVAKDLAIAVVDGGRGFGNGRVIPAGPLRARIAFQLGLVDCVVVMGPDPTDGTVPVFEDLKRDFQGPVLRGAVEAGETAGLRDSVLMAYAGIANPERFFRLVESFGPRRLTRRAFGDHHIFRQGEAAALLAAADAEGAELVTTEKDLARLTGGSGSCAELARRSRAVPIRVVLDERDLMRLRSLLDGVLKARGT